MNVVTNLANEEHLLVKTFIGVISKMVAISWLVHLLLGAMRHCVSELFAIRGFCGA
jgi:hypothetical protein